MATAPQPRSRRRPAAKYCRSGRALPSVEDLIQRLVARLKTTPDDANGWRMLGWSHFGIGRFQEAAAAYAKAIALQPTIGALHTHAAMRWCARQVAR